MSGAVNRAAKRAQLRDHWPPRTVAQLNDHDVMVVKVRGEGELFVVPRGVEHQPFAATEACLLLIEPRGTPNTGHARTAAPRREL
jgi:hypothetical protein